MRKAAPVNYSTRAASSSRNRRSDSWARSRRAATPCATRSARRHPLLAEGELPDPHELHEHAEKAFSRRLALVTAGYAGGVALARLRGENTLQKKLLGPRQPAHPRG